MTQPAAIETLTAALLQDLAAVHEKILAALDELAAQWPTLTVMQRRRALVDLDHQVSGLMGNADAVAARAVVQATTAAYQIGGTATALAMAAVPAFTQVDVDAITALAQDQMTDLLHATTGVRQDVKALIRELTRDHIRDKLYTGQTATQAAADLSKALRARGVAAVVYADGRRVTMPTYAEMVVRTKTAEAFQEGGLNQGERLGVDWWEILDGPGCGWTSHDDPDEANGKIVPLETARQHPLSHPNCRRSSTPRPDITTAREAAHATPVAPETVPVVWDAAVKAYRPATITLSTSPARQSTAVQLPATVPNTAAGRRFAATLAKHTA